MKITNIFYLINAIFQSIPSISTNNPIFSILPLAFVILLGMIRELVDELKRFKSDRKTNSRKYVRITSKDMSQREFIRSDEIRVGDIIELVEDQFVPTDCLLIWTSDPVG